MRMRLTGCALPPTHLSFCCSNRGQRSPFGARESAAVALPASFASPARKSCRSTVGTFLPVEVSISPVSQILPTFNSEGILDRGRRGAVPVVHSRALKRRSVHDYSFCKTNGSSRLSLDPAGLGKALHRRPRRRSHPRRHRDLPCRCVNHFCHSRRPGGGHIVCRAG